MSAVLLDTCALIWFAEGIPVRAEANAAVVSAALGDGVFVSPVSAWEVGLLCSRGRFIHAKTLAACEAWYNRFMARNGVREAALTAAIALQSTALPNLDHRDPADRFLIATARALAVPLVTNDQIILAYADAGHVRCIPC